MTPHTRRGARPAETERLADGLGRDLQPESSGTQLTLDAAAIPKCVICGKDTLREVAGWGPIHSVCEPHTTYATAPTTSNKAGIRARTGPTSPLGRVVLGLLREHGPQTDDELVARLPDEHPGSVSKRRRDLVVAGLVIDSGHRRLTRRNRESIVWAAAR